MTTYVSAGLSWGNNANSITPVLADVQVRAQGLLDACVGAGLVQTADTGQCVVASISNTSSPGYFVFRFNDSLQATYPLFIKLTMGRALNGGGTSLVVEVGTGTNGAGTLTTTGTAQTLNNHTSAGQGNFTMQLYACHTTGYFGMMGVSSKWPMPEWVFSVSRTKNAGGAFDGKGWVLWADIGSANDAAIGQYNNGVQYRGVTPSLVGSFNMHYCIAPGQPSNTALINGDKQLYPHFYADPSVKQLWSQFSVLQTEFGLSPGSFTAAPYNGEVRTFLFAGNGKAPFGEANNQSFRAAILWE